LLSGDSVSNDSFGATARLIRSRGNEYARNNRVTIGKGVFLRGPRCDVISKGESQLRVSSAREAVNRGPERVKLKNLHC
jgi:hypothetical protein